MSARRVMPGVSSIMKSRVPIERMHAIAARLRECDPLRQQVNCSVMAAQFECGRKAVLRDIDFMRDRLGWDIEYDQSRHSYILKSAPAAVL
jgi:predicted DNA-binding transcriptional regulator YafY